MIFSQNDNVLFCDLELKFFPKFTFVNNSFLCTVSLSTNCRKAVLIMFTLVSNKEGLFSSYDVNREEVKKNAC